MTNLFPWSCCSLFTFTYTYVLILYRKVSLLSFPFTFGESYEFQFSNFVFCAFGIARTAFVVFHFLQFSMWKPNAKSSTAFDPTGIQWFCESIRESSFRYCPFIRCTKRGLQELDLEVAFVSWVLEYFLCLQSQCQHSAFFIMELGFHSAFSISLFFME